MKFRHANLDMQKHTTYLETQIVMIKIEPLHDVLYSKILKTQIKETILKVTRTKHQLTYKGKHNKIMSVFLLSNPKTREVWSVVQALKIDNCQSWFLCSAKLLFFFLLVKTPIIIAFYSPNMIFLLIIWELHIMHPDHTPQSSPICPPFL